MRPFQGGTGVRISSAGGAQPHWDAAGRLYYFSPDSIMETTVTLQNGTVSAAPPARVVAASGIDFVPSDAGQRFLVFDRDPPRSIAIVNWKSLLPRQ